MGAGEFITYGLLFISLYFEVFLLVAFIERRLRKQIAVPAMTRLPKVAIAIPCFNEEGSVGATLHSLLSLDYPKELLELIVVDDGSTDGTFEAASAFAADPRVRVFQKDNGGKHTAMNLALANTDAELIGCLDADSIVEKEALLRIVPLFSDPRIAAVTPGIHVREPKTLLQHLQNVEYRLSLFNRYILAALGSAFITPGPFSFFRASVVRELGGWRYAHSTEDMEMALRFQEAGHLIANAPKAVVHTSTPATLPRLYRQRVRWTYGWLRNAVDYRHMIGNRRYGNLGLLILPSAVITIFTGIFFAARVLFYGFLSLYEKTVAISFSGIYAPQFELFYVNTSVMYFLVFASIGLILVLICLGTYIGTGRRVPPYSTPLFLLLYSLLVPIWLTVAVVRAALRTGVQWR